MPGTDDSNVQFLPSGNLPHTFKTRSCLRLLLVIAISFNWCIVIETQTAKGQALQKAPAPIQLRAGTVSDTDALVADLSFDIAAQPKTDLVISQGSVVMFVGKTIPDGKRTDVQITVRSSAGTKNLVGTIDKDGKFSVKFDSTQSVGLYTAVATAPDETGKAETKFKVSTALGIIVEILNEEKEAATVTNQALTAVTDSAGKLPVSPLQKDLLERIEKLKAKTGEMPAQIRNFDKAWWKIRYLLDTSPALQPAFQPMLNKMAAEVAELKIKTQEMRQQLDKSKKQGVLCDQLETINEVTNGISFLLNLSKKPITTFVNFLIDKGTPKAIEQLAENKGYSAATTFTATEAVKNSASAAVSGALDPLTATVGLANDLVQFAAQQAFNSYCEKFEGPINGVFRAEFDHEGAVWWKYDVTLAGKLTMRFAKTAKPGGVVAFTGQIEGNATSFKLWEDAVAITPKLRRNVLFHKSFAPPAIPAKAMGVAEEAGTLARMGTPGYFRIPVEGEIIGEKVTLNILPALNDFSDAVKGRAFYVFFEPIVPIPYFSQIEFPIQKAHFILSRGMLEKSEYNIVANKAAKASQIKRDFTRDWKSEKGDIRIKWMVSVRACNPKCS